MSFVRTIRLTEPFDLAATRFALFGEAGSTATWRDGIHRHATRNVAGAVQVAVSHTGDEIAAEAWGPGAEIELDVLPRVLGLDDDPGALRSAPGLVGRLARRDAGLRLGSTGRVFEALLPTILGQRVTGLQAKQGLASLVRTYGAAAPGPAGLHLPPEPESLAVLEYEDFHRHGVERSRADIVREAARRANRLEEIVTMGREAALARLLAVRGIGPWSALQVMGSAWGDRDAVPVGDLHLPNIVAWALAGEPRADDDRMLQLLEPYRPHRRRVVVMLKRAGLTAPKYGPRVATIDIRSR